MGAKRPKSLVIYMYLRSMPKIFITSDFFNMQSSPLYYQKSDMHNSLAPTYYLFRVNDTSKTPKFSFQFSISFLGFSFIPFLIVFPSILTSFPELSTCYFPIPGGKLGNL